MKIEQKDLEDIGLTKKYAINQAKAIVKELEKEQIRTGYIMQNIDSIKYIITEITATIRVRKENKGA